MNITEALQQAAGIVEGAGLPADLRVAAFEKAVDALLGSPTATGVGRGVSAGVETTAPAAGLTSALSCISRKLGVDEEVVSEVFDVRDGSLDVILGYSRFADGVAAGARELAVLVVAGRQASGIDADGWTSVVEIREICKEFNKFDEANFASTVTKMGDVFGISGKGLTRKVKMSRAGWEKAKQLVEKLTAPEGK
jgi:hypothetical protein